MKYNSLRLILKICAISLIFLGCGHQGSPSENGEKTGKSTLKKQDILSESATFSSQQMKQIDAVALLRIGGADGSSSLCNAFVIADGFILTAAHCLGPAEDFKKSNSVELYDASTPALKVQKKLISRVFIEESSADLEALALVGFEKTNIPINSKFDLKSAPAPQRPLLTEFYTLKFRDNAGVSSLKKCPVGRFNEQGLLAYDCDSEGGMSGAVVSNSSGEVIGMHLGRKSTLGYGCQLYALKEKILAAMAQP